MSALRGLLVSVMVSAASLATTADAQQAQRPDIPWSECCGMGQWPMGPDTMGPGMMGRGMGGGWPAACRGTARQ